MEEPKQSLDEVLDKFSMVGPFHLKFLFLAAVGYAVNAIYSSNYIFVAEESGYRCKDEAYKNNTCGIINDTSCSEWVYDNPHSFVAEFELACNDWKRRLVGTVHSFGNMMGLVIVGTISDRMGRKQATVMTGVLGAVFGVSKSFCTNYWLYIILAFMESAVGDIYSPIYILNLEMVSAKKRVMYNGFCGLGYVIGELLFPLTAWGIPYWRHFLRTIYAPSFLFISYICLMDESPRWLLTKGRKEQAVNVLNKMANGKVKLDKNLLDNLVVPCDDEEKSIGFVNLLKMTFKSRSLLKRCLVCIVWWTTSTFVSHGLMINSVSLEGNKYLNYLLVMFVEVPATFIIMYILIKFKRRKPLIIAFLASGVISLILPFLPKGLPYLSIFMYMITYMMSSVYMSITYMYTSELFPTYTRNSMHALCSSIGRIGSIVAPQTPALTVYWSGLPSVFFGGASLTAGLITFLVPDTGDNSLPDTVKQAEELGREATKGIENLAMSKESVMDVDKEMCGRKNTRGDTNLRDGT